MDSDVDMDMDAVTPSASKGKEKAIDICAPSNRDTLPWYVPRPARPRLTASHAILSG
jgi:hypothetical protein